ncbi:hypothetical protein J6590_075205 [Homalodisca vitripennis]|nr:hypothetical protein J6590_075205 [Homalodisca vitripennis]
MASAQQKAFCVLQFVKDESVVSVQRAFRRRFGIDPPSPKTFVDGIANLKRKGACAKNWLFSQLQADSGDFIFQQDGAPPHWHNNVRQLLNNNLPHRWIGRTGLETMPFILSLQDHQT